MSMDYIRKTYGVPAKRGIRVKFTGNPHNCPQFGEVTGAHGKYIKVRMDGELQPGTYHPDWRMEYLPPNETKLTGVPHTEMENSNDD